MVSNTLIIVCVETSCTDPADQPMCRRTLPGTSETSAQVSAHTCAVAALLQYLGFIMKISCFYVCICVRSLQDDVVFVEAECTSVSGGKRERGTSKVSLSTQPTVKGAPDCLCRTLWVGLCGVSKKWHRKLLIFFPSNIDWGYLEVLFLTCSLCSWDRL